MPDRTLFFIVTFLIAVGIMMSYSLSTYTVVFFGYNEFHFALRQAIFGMGSIIVMWSLAQLDPDVWLHRIGLTLFLVGLALMIAMPFLPSSLVTEVGGASRWIKLFGFSLAPVEFFKVGFVYFLAWSFARKIGTNEGVSLKAEMIRFIPYAVMFVIVMFLIAVIQKDLGQVVVLGLTLAFLLFFAGSSFRFFLTLLMSSLAFFVFFIVTAEHRVARIKSWWALAQQNILQLFPESVAKHLRIASTEEPYQIGHSLNAINNGGLFGTSLGSGTFKLGFLSEVHTDFVLAGIAEEFGFVGVLGVSMLFIWMLHRIFRVANRSQNNVYFLFSLGIGLLVVFAFMINAYGISGLTPIKGISVPFLSYGGSAMLGASIGIGMVLMASKKMVRKTV